MNKGPSMAEMSFPMKPRTPRAPIGAALSLTLLAVLAGCASTQLDAQWTDPQSKGSSLRGARVMVACEAADLTLKQICEDRFAAELTARGASPFVASAPPSPTPEGYLAAARDGGAGAVMLVQVSPAEASRSSPVSIGLGGFGFGGGGVSAGIGVTVPLGGGRSSIGYAANGRFTDVSNGRLMWTGRAVAAPSNQLEDQLDQLSKAIMGGAQQAGFF